MMNDELAEDASARFAERLKKDSAGNLAATVTLGYRIAGAHLVDLFPQTYHIESIFHLAR